MTKQLQSIQSLPVSNLDSSVMGNYCGWFTARNEPKTKGESAV